MKKQVYVLTLAILISVSGPFTLAGSLTDVVTPHGQANTGR
ncbi:hypothetical protein [Alkalicoccobacillus gibsonii]|nr:hypothetical protein [Alkalicoccobacillus gibsonii]